MKNLKKLMERRAELKKQMDALVDKADTEERAMSEEETRAFDEAEKEIQEIDATLACEERARKITEVQPPKEQHEMTVEERAAAEEQAFSDFIMGRVATENRAGEIQLTQGNNGSIVPTTIANRIIKAVRDTRTRPKAKTRIALQHCAVGRFFYEKKSDTRRGPVVGCHSPVFGA